MLAHVEVAIDDRAVLGLLVAGEGLEPLGIMEDDFVVVECQQLALAQLPQNTIYMDGTQSQCIREEVLTEGAGKLRVRSKANQLQAIMEFKEEVSRPLKGVAAPKAGQVLDHHGLISRGRPQDRSAEMGELGKNAHHL